MIRGMWLEIQEELLVFVGPGSKPVPLTMRQRLESMGITDEVIR